MPNLGTVNTTTSIATSAELTTAQAAAEAAGVADVDAHEADTTSIHGIANTANLYAAGGTDVAVADGGTGASTAAGARTNLGLVIGTDVPAVAHPMPLDAYAIDATYGDDFTAGSLNAAWTARNYTGETFAQGPKGTYLRVTKAGRARGDGYFRTAPAGDWTFAMAFIPRFVNGNAMAWGIGVVDTNGTGVGTCFYGGPPNAFLLGLVTTYSTYGGSFVQPGGAGVSPSIAIVPVAYWPSDKKVWVQLRKSGTTYLCSYSLDGEIWSPESGALTWTGTVDRVCMFDGPLGAITSGTGTGSFVDVDWFNKIA